MLSFFAEVRRGREKLFRPPFLLFLWVFLWLGVVQIFNQNSPSILYGLLGFKLYFYYIPLMYVSYALIRTDEDLRKFLITNISLAGLISLIAIIQAIVGHSFLNPSTLAPEIRLLGTVGPLFADHQSDANAAHRGIREYRTIGLYLVTMVILILGTAGYLLLSTSKYRKLVFVVMGLLVGGVVFSGSRGRGRLRVISAVILVGWFSMGSTLAMAASAPHD